MNPILIETCYCAYCDARIEPAEARAAHAILERFEEESFWEVMTAMGTPSYKHDEYSPFHGVPTACLECVTQAMFSLVVAPGGHWMLG